MIFLAVQETNMVYETFLVRICCLHRLVPNWTFDEYSVQAKLYHGTRPITSQSIATKFVAKTESLYERVKFDAW